MCGELAHGEDRLLLGMHARVQVVMVVGDLGTGSCIGLLQMAGSMDMHTAGSCMGEAHPMCMQTCFWRAEQGPCDCGMQLIKGRLCEFGSYI